MWLVRYNSKHNYQKKKKKKHTVCATLRNISTVISAVLSRHFLFRNSKILRAWMFARFVIKWFAEDWSLLGCYAFSDGYLTTFQKNTLLLSRGPSGPKFWLLNNEYDGIIIHRNVGIYQSTRRHVPENLTVHIIFNADIPLCFLLIKVKVKVVLEEVMEAQS
jgi:hypothetical protein